jgi:hypothetical protein
MVHEGFTLALGNDADAAFAARHLWVQLELI